MPPAASTPDNGQSEIGRSLDATPLTYLHLLIVFGTGLGLIFDTLEAAMTNVLATVFATQPGVERADLTLLLVAVFAGGAIGAATAGRIADAIGRRATLLIALVGYAAASIVAGFLDDLGDLALARFVGGMFLASYPPLMWTYLADVLPPKQRGRLMMLCGAAGSLGSVLAPTLARSLDGILGAAGWQLTFIVGGLGGVGVALLTLTLPESPRWLERTGRRERAARSMLRFASSRRTRWLATVEDLAAPARVEVAPGSSGSRRGPDFGKRLVLLLTLHLLQPLGVIGFAALSGVVLAKKGYDTHSSLLFVGVGALGAPIGAILASMVVDRLPRHLTYSVCALFMAALGLAFGISSSPAAAMGIGMLYMVVLVLFTMVLNIYGPEMFITEVRGFAAGLAYSANRIGAMMVPLVLLPLLLETNATVMFSLIAATLVLSAGLVMLFGPRNLSGSALR